MQIGPSGTFRGEAEVNVAEVAGRFEGKLLAHDRLSIRSTGKVVGNIRFSRLEVELGGEISGDIDIAAAPASAPPRRGVVTPLDSARHGDAALPAPAPEQAAGGDDKR
jgi:cytoskeletal protein CcmA (bactofilin family)